jgi:hypothetical protein
MKIEFTRTELKNLIELLYFGDFMADSSRETYPEKIANYDRLLQKIHRIAYQNGMTDFLKPFEDKIYPTRDFEEDEFIMDVIDTFENESFWMELIFLLSKRDVLEKMTVEEYQKLDMIARIELETEHEEPYHKEFSENGIRNLRILSSDLSFLRKK